MSGPRKLLLCSSFYGLHYARTSVEAYFSDPKAYLRGQRGFQTHFPTDFLLSPVFITGEALQYGSTIKFKQHTGPVLKNPAYEIDNTVPDVEPTLDTPYYDYMLEANRLLKQAYPEKSLVTFLSSPLDFGIMVFGMLRWLDMLLFERSRFFHWLDRFERYHADYRKALIASGNDLVVVTNIFLNSRIISDELIRGVLLPRLRESASTEAPQIIHSTFMPVTESIRYLETLPSTAGYVLDHRDKGDEVRSLIAGGRVLVGQLNADYLYRKHPEAITRNVVDLLTHYEDYPDFVLATSGSDLNLLTSEEQIKAIYEGIKRYEEK